MQRTCQELTAVHGPQAAVPGQGRHPTREVTWQWERGAPLHISFPLLETELRKHQAQSGLRMPCQLDKPRRWIWQPGQGQRGPALGTGQIRKEHRDRLPVGVAWSAPASCGHLLQASSSLCLVDGSICSCSESRGEGEQREKAQLVDEQKEACRKPSPRNTSSC